MARLWLTYYCYPDCEPFRNIMRLPRREAFALAKRLWDAHPETTAFYRFGDFENYYPRRLKTDGLMYEKFCALGGKPRAAYPLSFVLGSSQYLHRWFGEGKVYLLPVDAVPPEIISFTMGDSMSTLQRQGDVTLLTLPMLQAEMALHPEGAAGYLQQMQARHHYVEAQLWGDVPAGEYSLQEAEE